MKQKEDGDSVHMDGITVCEDEDQQIIEAIDEECGKEIVKAKVGRQRIDKYGNPIEEGKENETFDLAQVCPERGLDDRSLDAGKGAEIDAEAKRLEMLNQQLEGLLKEYNDLLQKERNGTLSKSELKRLLEVEQGILDVLREKQE